MHTHIRHLNNIRPLAIQVERTDFPNVPLESVIVDALVLALTNETCDVVEVIDGAKKYTINATYIINQIKDAVGPK